MFQTTDKQQHPSETHIPIGETSLFCEGEEGEGEEEGEGNRFFLSHGRKGASRNYVSGLYHVPYGDPILSELGDRSN